MKKKKCLCLFFTVVISILMTIPLSTLGAASYQTNYEIHAPIRIDGNAQFTVENGIRSGDGTIEHPYVISGWRIFVSFSDLRQGVQGIAIYNTSAFFSISNCIISSLGGRINKYIKHITEHENNGIYLQNVTNGLVQRCIVQGLFSCIHLENASSNLIRNCTSFRNVCGIGLNRGSNNNTVEFCRTNNFGCSICLWDNVHNNSIIHNECFGAPIRVFNSSYNLIQDCTFAPSIKRNFFNFFLSTIGIDLNHSDNNTISHCTFLLKRIGVRSIASNNTIDNCRFVLCLKQKG